MPAYRTVVTFSLASALTVLSTATIVEPSRRLPAISSTRSDSPISVPGEETISTPGGRTAASLVSRGSSRWV